MNAEKLVFNGVNGVSGTYGLEPMTSEDLAKRILGSTARKSSEQKALEDRLKQEGAKKIAALVRLLAESNFEKVERDDAWHSGWLKRLAQTLAADLLGDEYTGQDRLKKIEDRLRRHTVEKIENIVEFLLAGRSDELADLLLKDQDEVLDDNRHVLKEQLKRDAMSRLSDVQKNLLAPSRAGDLETDEDAQNGWLGALITALQMVPITALNTIRGVTVRPLKPLVKALDDLAANSASPSPWLEDLRKNLEAKPVTMPWNELLEALAGGLRARIAAQDDAVSWSDLLAALNKWLSAVRGPMAHLGVIEGVDRTDLAQAGWGVIFPYEDPQRPARVSDIKQALKPLLDLRGEQTGKYFKIYEGGQGYRPNDTASKFLGRHGARASDPADPKKVPYYLLIVGSPEEIPFHFQYQLDVQYAVGRIDFGDDLAAYANYARSIVTAESGEVSLAPSAALFGTANPGDSRGTGLSAEYLVKPLHERLKGRYGSRWQIKAALHDEATRPRLVSMMGGEDTPAFLFAACHGMEFPPKHPEEQLKYQGALLCQEWRESQRGKVPRDYYLAGEDLGDEVNLEGLIAFFFACYSAGTPRFDEYTRQAFKDEGETITEQPFIAALPTAMLSRGALAVVGHVERAWGASFLGSTRRSAQIAVFESAVERLLKGHPVGSAMEYFNGRYAALSTELTATLERYELPGVSVNSYELADMWTANNDARGYIVIGDPAVRLPVAGTAESATGRRDLSVPA